MAVDEHDGARLRLLLLAANPADGARLDQGKEVREIKAKIRESSRPGSVELRCEWAVRPDDVIRLLDEFRPHIVHFSGHGGDDENALLLEDDEGDGKPVGPATLARMFQPLKHEIRLVVFNVCRSLALANALAEHIDCTIGVDGAIGDRAAVVLAATLYRAILSGYSVGNAFAVAVAAMEAEGVAPGRPPVLVTRRLAAGERLDAREVVLLDSDSRQPQRPARAPGLGSGLRAVPHAPPHYLPRRDTIDQVVHALLGGASKVGISAVSARPGRLGVFGLGGIGKSVVAAAVARSQAVKERFGDGVLWLSLGQEPAITTLQAQLAAEMGHEEVFESAAVGHLRLRELFRDRAVLLVLDDVWELDHAGKLDVVGRRGQLLLTTRNRAVLTALGAAEYQLDVLPLEHARALLAEWAGCTAAALPKEAAQVARLCGFLPLALAMIGAMVRGGETWSDVRASLQQADIADIAHRMSDYPYEDVVRALEVSVHALEPGLRARYVDLAVFAEDEAIPEKALAVLWAMDERKVRRTLRSLEARSLVLRDGEGQAHLHDLQRMYVCARAGNLAARHGALVDAYARQCPAGLARGPAAPDAYFFARLVAHLLAAGRHDDARALLWDAGWLDAKLRAVGVAELCADFEMVGERGARDADHGDDLGRLRDALRLSSHVVAEDPDQLPGQLIGRLDYFAARDLRIRALLEQLRTRTGPGWLCPIVATLTPPGGPLVRTLVGHADPVWAVAATAHGTRALSASSDSTIKVWDLARGCVQQTLRGHMDAVRAVAVTADGRRAVSGSSDRTVMVWDLDSGARLHTLSGHGASVRAVAVSDSGRRAVSGSSDRTVMVWDLERGVVEHTLAGHEDAIWAVAITPDGQRALSASGDRTVKVWELGSGAELCTLVGHGAAVRAVAVTADGSRAVSASNDRTVKIWDVDRGREVRTLAGHAESVRAVAVTRDGSRAVSGSSDRTVKVWDVDRGREVQTLRGHSALVRAVALTSTGGKTRALSASNDKTVKVWDLDSKEAAAHAGHTDAVCCVAIAGHGEPQRRRALSASNDKTIKIWNLHEGREVATLVGHGARVRAVAVTPDGRRALSASNDKTIKIWNLDTYAEERTLRGHADRVMAVAATPDGKRALSASYDRTVKIWNLASGVEERTLVGHDEPVWAVAATPDGRRALSASYDRTVKIWNLASGTEERTLIGHSAAVWAVAVTPDGARALSASYDRTVKIWNLASGTEERTLVGHGASVWAVAVSADGGRALTASDDHRLVVWDLATGQPVHTFTSDGHMLSCAIGPGNDIYVAGDAHGRVHFLRPINNQ